MKFWKSLERDVAQEVEGTLQPGSGSSWSRPGDVDTRFEALGWTGVLYECKQTAKASFSVTPTILAKIEREAAISCRLPVLVVEVGGRRLAILEFQALADIVLELSRDNGRGGVG